jgi:hypothetical protein
MPISSSTLWEVSKMSIRQGPGFPLTRQKRVLGFSEALLIYVVLALLGVVLGLDSVELGRLLEYLKGLDVSIPLS